MRALAASATLFLCVLARAGDLSLTYQPVWPGLPLYNGLVPLRVEVKNSGKDTAGFLKVQSRSGSMTYPVELPRGADKVVTVYLAAQSFWGNGTLDLETPLGKQSVEVEFPGGSTPGVRSVGAISTSLGVLSNLATAGGGTRNVRGATCLPNVAPERSVGYQCLAALILGEGSENLSDSAVTAIQRYVLKGGTLVFTGGPSAPWLRDSRWAQVMPVTPVSTRTFGKLQTLGQFVDEPLAEAVSVTVASPKKGAQATLSQDGTAIIVERQIGLGRVIFWAFDPFDAPVRTWAGQKSLFSNLVQSKATANKYLGVEDSYDEYSGSRRFSGNSYADTNDPFSVHMPAAWKMAAILFGFIIVVIPVNFLVLQSLKRREWAWMSIPLISLGFSAIIFATAQGLYSAESARSTSGVVIAHSGVSTAVFVGEQQLFLPKAGVYDLGFHGVESAEVADERHSMRRGPTLMTEVGDLIDVGEVVAPQLRATNLTFRSYDLVQSIEIPGKLAFNPIIKSLPQEWSIDGQLTNSTPWKLHDAILVYGVSSASLGDIDPGESMHVDVRIPKAGGQKWSGRMLPDLGKAVGLESKVSQIPVGTNIGAESVRGSGTRLLYTWDVEVGP